MTNQLVNCLFAHIYHIFGYIIFFAERLKDTNNDREYYYNPCYPLVLSEESDCKDGTAAVSCSYLKGMLFLFSSVHVLYDYVL